LDKNGQFLADFFIKPPATLRKNLFIFVVAAFENFSGNMKQLQNLFSNISELQQQK
jgi:hypothetical protein